MQQSYGLKMYAGQSYGIGTLRKKMDFFNGAPNSGGFIGYVAVKLYENEVSASAIKGESSASSLLWYTPMEEAQGFDMSWRAD